MPEQFMEGFEEAIKKTRGFSLVCTKRLDLRKQNMYFLWKGNISLNLFGGLSSCHMIDHAEVCLKKTKDPQT